MERAIDRRNEMHLPRNILLLDKKFIIDRVARLNCRKVVN